MRCHHDYVDYSRLQHGRVLWPIDYEQPIKLNVKKKNMCEFAELAKKEAVSSFHLDSNETEIPQQLYAEGVPKYK